MLTNATASSCTMLFSKKTKAKKNNYLQLLDSIKIDKNAKKERKLYFVSYGRSVEERQERPWKNPTISIYVRSRGEENREVL